MKGTGRVLLKSVREEDQARAAKSALERAARGPCALLSVSVACDEMRVLLRARDDSALWIR
ncbi:Hypothetical protein CAP_5193 [Chondromyces apiculatus DSM 436]|uniref:Uncharacterized protein n=1 Tax=Chondromyces apiculatus DSM 436 TaxID=1192034 RepID=A0A017T3E1_9BACT|nr:Hypothetical protein CAP_5193 [Chondromyces apiculatus DSM 436]